MPEAGQELERNEGEEDGGEREGYGEKGEKDEKCKHGGKGAQ